MLSSINQKNINNSNIIVVIIILFLALNCSSNRIKVEYGVFQFSIHQDKPVFVDEYLYPKANKSYQQLNQDDKQWFLIDWNNNGKYHEIGIDYLGLKTVNQLKPILSLLNNRNYVKIDQDNYIIAKIDDFQSIRRAKQSGKIQLSSISRFNNIKLINGEAYSLKTDDENETYVIYFWATWCRPCINTLKNIDIEKLKTNSIRFIPIAYNCSNIEKFLNDNHLNFQALEISEESAELYNLNSLPRYFVFDKFGKLLNNNSVNIDEYLKS